MTDFSPHAILRHPLTSDEDVWNLIRFSLASSENAGPVVLLIEPHLPPRKGQASSLGPWQALGKPAARMSP